MQVLRSPQCSHLSASGVRCQAGAEPFAVVAFGDAVLTHVLDAVECLRGVGLVDERPCGDGLGSGSGSGLAHQSPGLVTAPWAARSQPVPEMKTHSSAVRPVLWSTARVPFVGEVGSCDLSV